MRLTQKAKVDIINGYETDLTPMQELAERHGITRQGVYKILKQAGIDTSDRKITVSCTTCGRPIDRHKARVRRQLHHFCNTDCYHIFLEVGNGNLYVQNRHGQRVGRAIAGQFVEMLPGYVIHHKDRNTLNNNPSNLMVFRNQGDHIRHHRGFDVEPVWAG